MDQCVIYSGQIQKVLPFLHSWGASNGNVQYGVCCACPAIFTPAPLFCCLRALVRPPTDIQGWGVSPRGAGYLFGGDVVDEVFYTHIRTLFPALPARARTFFSRGPAACER